jgi:kynurenine 3-monooxygenase
MLKSKKISVIGGGLVGSLWSIFLVRKGFTVDLYERRSDLRTLKVEAGRSINLIITTKGINALKELGIDHEVLSQTVPVHGRMIHKMDGECIYQPYGVEEHHKNYSISRFALNKHLLHLAENNGVRVHFDHPVQSVDLDKMEIHFSQKTVRTDHIFGTDGSSSAVRKAILNQKNAINGINETEWLNVDYKELHIPAGTGNSFLIEKHALHIWPRGNHFLMALPNLNGSFTATLYLPTKGERAFSEITTEKKLIQYFDTFYPDATTLIPNLEEDFFRNPIGHLGTVKSSPWFFQDKAVLLGDAAHAIVPFFGQGMNAGFDDCLQLSEILTKNKNNFSTSFEQYFQTQKPNADAIAQMAVENYHEMSHHVGDQRFLFQKEIENKLMTLFPGKYHSRYSLVVYNSCPYRQALDQGLRNQKILDELSKNISKIEQLDLNLAAKLIEIYGGPN